VPPADDDTITDGDTSKGGGSVHSMKPGIKLLGHYKPLEKGLSFSSVTSVYSLSSVLNYRHSAPDAESSSLDLRSFGFAPRLPYSLSVSSVSSVLTPNKSLVTTSVNSVSSVVSLKPPHKAANAKGHKANKKYFTTHSRRARRHAYQDEPYFVVYAIHTDHLGTPIAMTNDDGEIVWTMNQSPFGEVPNINDDFDEDDVHITLNLRFPGQYFDEESGLNYNWHRYYDPQAGIYLQHDAVILFKKKSHEIISGWMPLISTYNYVGNDPMWFLDPWGLWAMGFSITVSTVAPTSGGGGLYGINGEYTSSNGFHWYKFFTPQEDLSSGFNPGISVTGNIASGDRPWTGPFEEGSGSFDVFTGGYFNSPLDQKEAGYYGINFGFNLGFPVGLGFARTKYKRAFPDEGDKPCK